MIEFICDYDMKVMLTTIITCSIIIICTIIFIGLFLYKMRNSKGVERIRYMILIVTLFIPPLCVFFFTGRSAISNISIDEKSIYINIRNGSSINVNLDSISEIRRLTPEEYEGTIRTNASGGLFGYRGDFYNPQLGDFKQYSTNLDKRILIKTTGDIWVVSCAEPDKFIAVVKEKISK